MSVKPQSSGAASLTAFAVATLAVGVVAIAALDRAGAPDQLVRALGPMLALIALSVFAIAGQTATLAEFIAVSRRAVPSHAAFAVAAIATGVALVLSLRTTPATDPIFSGAIAGVWVGMAALGPLIRRFGAASLSDVVATRFPNPLVRGVLGVAVAAAGTLIAFAGYRTVVTVAEALVTASRPWAEAIVAAVLIASVASGGLTSLIGCAMASGGGVAAIAVIGWAFASQLDPATASHATAAFALPPASLASPEPLAAFVGAMAGAACVIGAAAPTAACSNASSALKAGLGGILLFVAIASLTFAGAPVFLIESGLATAGPVAASLGGAATIAAALALAGVGVLGASRAFGVALACPPQPFPTLASVRLARMRAAQAAIVVVLAAADRADLVDPATALIVAMALALAVAAPISALATVRRAGPLAAVATTLTAAAVSAARLTMRGAPPAAADLVADALAAAAAALLVGLVAAMFAPRRGPAPTPGAFDRFSRPSG